MFEKLDDVVGLCLKYCSQFSLIIVAQNSLLCFVIEGVRAESGTRQAGGTQGYQNDGIQGLKALGVRDLSYKMAFLACTVSPCNRKVSN